MRKAWKIVLGVVALLFVLVAVMMMVMGGQMRELEALDYAGADISQLADGTYRGRAEALLVKAEAEVEVAAGRIARVRLIRHDHGLGSAAEAIVERFAEESRVDVDTVSGATASSIVIKAAVLDALTQGGQ